MSKKDFYFPELGHEWITSIGLGLRLSPVSLMKHVDIASALSRRCL